MKHLQHSADQDVNQVFKGTTELSPASRRQPWKVISVAISVALLSASAAHAEDQGWYASANAGIGHRAQDSGGIDSTLAGQGVTATSSLDRRDNIYNLNLGYQFHKNFALEGGFAELGKYKFNSTASAPAADSLNGDYRVKGWTISAIGILPLQNGFSAYGKAGVIFADTEFNVASATGANTVTSTSKSSTRPLLGLGVSYDFNKQVVGKAEWTRYNNLGNSATGKSDIDTYTVGVAYKF